MEIIFTDTIAEVSGKLANDDAYQIVKRRMPDGTLTFHSERVAKYNRAYADDRHARFILRMARLALDTRHAIVTDIRVTVREFVDARVSAVTGKPLDAFDKAFRNEMLRLWCGILKMHLRKVKPSSILNARDIWNLRELLNPPV